MNTPGSPSNLAQELAELRARVGVLSASESELRHCLAVHQACQIVREAVWRMTRPDDTQMLLEAVQQSLKALDIPFYYWGINLIGSSPDAPVIGHSLSPRGDSFRGQESSQLLWDTWQSGQPAYRRDLLASDEYSDYEHFRGSEVEVRSVLDVPFSHGTLALSSPTPHAFTETHIAALQTLAAVLSEGFRRRGELAVLQARNDELTSQLTRDSAHRTVRQALWEMRDTAQLTSLLEAIRDAFDQLGIPYDVCGINVVSTTRPISVTQHMMRRDGNWYVVESQKPDLIESFRCAPEPVYRRDLHVQDPYGEREEGGPRSILDVPFAHGTLAVDNAQPNAFTPGHIERLRDLAAVVEEGFRRLQDLVDLELRNRELQAEIAQRRLAEARLQQAHDELEVRVLERTAALGEVNKALVDEVAQRRQTEVALAERLEFQRLLSAISTRFVTAAPPQVGEQVEESLQLVGEYLDLDAIVLLQFQSEESVLRRQYYWATDQIQLLPNDTYPLDRYHHMVDSIRRSESLIFHSIRDVPPDWQAECAWFNQTGARSLLIVPLRNLADVTGSLLFASARTACHWHDETVARARLIGELIGSALQRQQRHQELQEQLRYQSLVADIAGRFVNVPVEAIDAEVQASLQQMGDFLDLDYTGLSDLSDDGECLLPAHLCFLREGIAGLPRQVVRCQDHRWLFEPLLAGRHVTVSQVADLPEAAALASLGFPVDRVASMLIVPLRVKGRTTGVLSLATTRRPHYWDDEFVARAHLLAGILGNALLRKHSEESYHSLVQSLDGIVCTIGRDGRFSFVSDRVRQYGYEPADLIGTGDFAFVHDEDRSRVLARLQQTLAAGVDPDEPVVFRVLTRDGEVRWMEVRSHVQRKAGGMLLGVSSYLRDITSARQAEEERRLALALLTAVVEQYPTGLIVVGSPDYRVRLTNPMARQVLGLAPDVILDPSQEDLPSLIQLYHPDSQVVGLEEQPLARVWRGDLIRDLARVWRGDLIRDQEYTVRGHGSAPRWVLASAGPVRDEQDRIVAAVIAFVDITARKRAEQVALYSELKYRSLFEEAGDGILLMQGPLFVDCNARALELFGATRDQLIGTTPERHSPPEQSDGRNTAEAAAAYIQAALAGEPQKFEWQHRRLDGVLFDVEVSLVRIDIGAEPIIQAIVHDVTERKRAEAARRQAEEELARQRALSIRADRLRSLGEMSASIAHELNQPLAGVRGFAEHILLALDRGWELTVDTLRERLAGIVRQADRMTHIIEHIRTFSSQAGRRDTSPVDLNEVVCSATDMVEAQLRSRGIKLTTDLMAGIPMVSANFFSLEEVILNLLNNARDAIEEATTKGLPNHPEIRVCTACQGNQVELQVCDSGIGIRPEIMGRLFEPFFTTKDTARGTGLGLPICRAILEDFHGTIEIESTPGHGAVARIRLPAMDGYF